MMSPPWLVERPLNPCPALRSPSGTSRWRLAKASASATPPDDAGRSTRPGAPPRVKVDETVRYSGSPGATAVPASDSGIPS
jgi:hypothetical protein